MQADSAFQQTVIKIKSGSTEHYRAGDTGHDSYFKCESNFYLNYSTKEFVHEEWTLIFNGNFEDDGVDADKRTITASSYGTFDNVKSVSENSITFTFKKSAKGNLRNGLSNSVLSEEKFKAVIIEQGKYKFRSLKFEKFPILGIDSESSWFSEFQSV
jgi:hypothetical protein